MISNETTLHKKLTTIGHRMAFNNEQSPMYASVRHHHNIILFE